MGTKATESQIWDQPLDEFRFCVYCLKMINRIASQWS